MEIFDEYANNFLRGLKHMAKLERQLHGWKDIKGYSNYDINKHTQIKNIKTGKIMKQHISKNGYYVVNLTKNGIRKQVYVHRLMALTFLTNPDNKPCCDHKNGIKTDNRITNLRWATAKENSQNCQISKRNKSGVKGVDYHKHSKKWRAFIMIDGIQVHLGLFDDLEDAKKARFKRANKAYGEFVNSCEKI
jgi:hypothetical protein